MRQIYKIAIVVLALMLLIEILTKVDLTIAIFITAVIIGFFGIPLISKSFRIVSIIFLIIGLVLLVWYHQPFTIWMASFNYMTNLISILTVMQLFTIPIEAGKYNLAIRHQLKRFCSKEGSLFFFTMFITNIFSSFLMMGVVPVVVSLMEDTIKNQVPHYKRFIARAVSRGFALGILWAPGAATIFLVGQVTGAGWSKVFFPGLFLSFAGMVVSYLLELKKNHVSVMPGNPDAEMGDLSDCEEKENRRKIWHIAGAVISLVALTMLFIRLKIGSSSTSVILSGVIVFLAWILLIRKELQLKTSIKNYWDNAILKAADLAPFFVAIGVFSGGFAHSGLNRFLELSLQGFAGSLGLFAIILVPLTIILLALLGLHPLVSITLLGQILMTLHLPLPLVTIALCLNLGASLAYMVSPFAGIIMTISKFIDAKATDVAIRWNGLFCIIYFVLGISAAYCLGRIFP